MAQPVKNDQAQTSRTFIPSGTLENSQINEELQRANTKMKKLITKTILVNEGNAESLREKIRKYFHSTYDIDESLYENVLPQYIWTRGDPLRHPVGWYLAHTAVLFANKLRTAQLIKEPVNKTYESKFAVGVDEMSWDDRLEERHDWPNFEDIKSYRNKIRALVNGIIEKLPLQVPINWDSQWWAILMGIEHERIHLETSSVLIRQLPLHMVKPSDLWANECPIGRFSDSDWKVSLGSPGHAPKNELLPVKGQTVSYGRKIDSSEPLPVYGWDNEYGEMVVDVPDFKASKYLVSNEEYYEFVLDKGYTTQEYWSEEGWKWVTSTKTTLPKFWRKSSNGGFKLRNMASEIPLPWDWPVITNHLESLAFCAWKAKKSGKNIRLPTEDEYHALRLLCNNNNPKYDQPYWDKAPGNGNFEYYASECPVDLFEYNKSGFYDIIGNVWQHTLTPQHPFKGFIVHPYYDDFTVPCFGSKHSIIKGGSWISTGNGIISLSRYQFRRHFFQHAGIRYVESSRDLSYLELLKDNNTYSNNHMINLYTHFHYWNENYFGVENFPYRVANVCKKYSDPSMRNKALDIGCATGRCSYELAKIFNHVTGLDITARLIGVGYRLQELGYLEWEIPKEGEIMDRYKITAKELDLENVLHKVYFAQNDAQNIDAQYTDYDLIVASNLIDRLSNPLLFLTKIHERINKNGVLILLSPYTWLEQFTEKSLWIGGQIINDQSINTFDSLKLILNDKFELIDNLDVPFVIRETARKFQHTISHCTIWKRK